MAPKAKRRHGYSLTEHFAAEDMRSGNFWGAASTLALGHTDRVWREVRAVVHLAAFAVQMFGHAKGRELRERVARRIRKLPPELRAPTRALVENLNGWRTR